MDSKTKIACRMKCMRKWIEYQFCLIRLSWSNTREFLEPLGGNYGQIIYTLLAGFISFVLLFVINYKLGNVGSFLETIFIPLIGALAGALIANVIVFILHFINSKRDLYNEIGVRRYSDFDIKKVEVQFSTGNVFPPQLHLSVINRSPYLLKDCGIYGCSISTISEHPKTIPETRLLRWIDRQSGKRDLKDNSAVFVFETKERDHINEYGWFATQSISPHKVQHGTCIAKLELRANYLWKKVKFPITIRIVYGQNHVEGTLLQSA